MTTEEIGGNYTHSNVKNYCLEKFVSSLLVKNCFIRGKVCSIIPHRIAVVFVMGCTSAPHRYSPAFGHLNSISYPPLEPYLYVS
jgi:hypothetical protein